MSLFALVLAVLIGGCFLFDLRPRIEPRAEYQLPLSRSADGTSPTMRRQVGGSAVGGRSNHPSLGWNRLSLTHPGSPAR
jgi:hypothetical protein